MVLWASRGVSPGNGKNCSNLLVPCTYPPSSFAPHGWGRQTGRMGNRDSIFERHNNYCAEGPWWAAPDFANGLIRSVRTGLRVGHYLTSQRFPCIICVWTRQIVFRQVIRFAAVDRRTGATRTSSAECSPLNCLLPVAAMEYIKGLFHTGWLLYISLSVYEHITIQRSPSFFSSLHTLFSTWV